MAALRLRVDVRRYKSARYINDPYADAPWIAWFLPFPYHSVLRIMADEKIQPVIRGDGSRRRCAELRQGLRDYKAWLHGETDVFAHYLWLGLQANEWPLFDYGDNDIDTQLLAYGMPSVTLDKKWLLRPDEESTRTGFGVVTWNDLEKWAFESSDPLRTVRVAREAARAAGSNDDPVDLSLQPKPKYRERIRELRQIAYRLQHKPRRERPTKLTFEKCEEIKLRTANGESRSALAKEYGVSTTYVWQLATGFTKRMNWSGANV